ncbi:unnamed protein product [Parnassius mnemosyne]|uniref:Uncharacterized protein n=1 Tax=Parnassius mnemosyne TaxID=213953 RepID=A0AAV1LHP3_9NEOP
MVNVRKHVQKLDNEYWEKDIGMENVMEYFIIETCIGEVTSEEARFYESINATGVRPDHYALNHKFNKERLGGNVVNSDREQYEAEKKAGDMTALLGLKYVHYRQPHIYTDLGRRFVPQYPYYEIAPPELVLAVARESALLEGAKPINPTDEIIRENVLRTGDYWNSVWKEDVYSPVQALRTKKDEDRTSEIEIVPARIKPGSKFYRLISMLKKISPRLLYVINNDDRI